MSFVFLIQLLILLIFMTLGFSIASTSLLIVGNNDLTTLNKIIIVVGENWHEGVIGIAASRLQEKYYRPIIIIATKDNIGKASCRSIDGLHMKMTLLIVNKI